jgi:hypothetical protein
MSTTINTVKQLRYADTPLLLFECTLSSGDVERWCSTSINFNSNLFAARVLKHNLFALQLSADDAMDGLSQLSITLANADSLMSEISAQIGFRGARLTVYFVFADLTTGEITTESTVLFLGICGDPDTISEESVQLTFTNKLSLIRVMLPDVRIQSQCPWSFPSSQSQRASAVDATNANKYSPFYKCGYSADHTGGRGTLNGSVAYTSCDLTRASCVARGMFSQDASNQVTRRFGGIEYVPTSYLVRGFGDKASALASVLDNVAKYNDPAPLVYGTGWLMAPVIFSRNDGNLTHMEVLLGTGAMQGVLKVIVNDIEIPIAVNGTNMTATGWYNLVTTGTATGAFDYDFVDSSGNPVGDPYGSLSVLLVVVPNSISTGTSLPTVEVLAQGLQLDQYATDGTYQDTAFTNNPAWVILDILRRANWLLSEINLASFASAAAFCAELIQTTDLNGNPESLPNYGCNLLLIRRRSAAEIVRGVRVACGLMLRYGAQGLLELVPETTLANQSPTLPDGSNSTAPLSGGWPSYEFSDASGTFSGIVREDDGSSSVALLSRSVPETANRMAVEFQDEDNEYQQNSLSVVNAQDTALMGYEISSTSTALGIPNFNQASRVLALQLAKSTEGNQYIEFQTSFRALKVRPGDIITVTYAKEGLVRLPYRVVRLSPSLNYRRITVLAQIHNDQWYSDNPNVILGAGRIASGGVGTPRPLLGPTLNSSGTTDFQITEQLTAQSDGGITDSLQVAFVEPAAPSGTIQNLPLVSLSPVISQTGGSLVAGTFYYACSAVDSSGNETVPSFTVAASVPSGSTNTVTLTSLSFPIGAAAFHVYRGLNPQLLYRIATNQALAATFTDTGLAAQPIGPADPNYNHANFYFRQEFAGPLLTSSSTQTSITSTDLNATANEYTSNVCRITIGTGAGQEQQIISNDATTLTVTPGWSILPDSTSQFVIAEASWHFGAVSVTSPAEFQIPNQSGSVIEVSGRGANALNQEGSADLCPMSRWVVGGGTTVNGSDVDVPPLPGYSLAAPGDGDITVSSVEFTALTNTQSITAGTLQMFLLNELSSGSAATLASAADGVTTTLSVNAIGAISPGGMLLIDSELMVVLSVNSQANTLTVVRGAVGSAASSHASAAGAYQIQLSTHILPFAAGFFDNPQSANYSLSIHVPDVRVVAAQFYMTNARGNGQAATQCLTGLSDGGLRTLSGGQLSLQVAGTLAIQQSPTPPLFVEASHAIEDVRAVVGTAPSGGIVIVELLQSTNLLCTLTIPDGQTTSNVVDGAILGPLLEGSSLTINITDVPVLSGTTSGSDLTVTIRL